MAFQCSFLITLLLIQFLPFLCLAEDFDFFYFILQWPGSYCDDTSKSCCFPTTGKPAADFGIRGLWPNYNDGTYPSNCDANNPYDPSQVSDLISKMQQEWPTLACPSGTGSTFWAHEWTKHGTCSESILDQHSYFASALNLKNKLNILKILEDAGIVPDKTQRYSLSSIQSAMESEIGYIAYVKCNTDASGNSQLYQVHICVDTDGSSLIQCPALPAGKCNPESILLPMF